MKKIPCVMMRGGTSRGAFLLAEHLPEDQTQRDKILMAIMGSGNDLEIDGIGGGNPLTSKVAIISRSSDPRADVDYLFAQVIVHEQRVDTTPNCGNMLSGVGAFAIENGLIAATSPVTRVRTSILVRSSKLMCKRQMVLSSTRVAPELTAYRVLPHRLRSLS